MLSDEIGRQLHDRATRGKLLTSEEHKMLEKWYDEQDKTESESVNPVIDARTEQILRKQIDSILLRIGVSTEQIHKLTDENRLLRKDMAHPA